MTVYFVILTSYAELPNTVVNIKENFTKSSSMETETD